jgi:hypothetical protein
MNARKLIALCPAVLLALGAEAQLALNGTNYVQNFDGLDSGLPAGWMVNTNASATNAGSPVSFATSRTNWGSSTGAFGNYASTTNDAGAAFLGSESPATQSACANRALGIRQTSTFGDPGSAFVLNITNTSGMANFQLGLDFLMLSVQSRSTVWTLDYAVGNNPTRFTPLATFADPGIFGTTHTNIFLGTALDRKSSNVWIRVAALNPSTGGGSRDTFALDNFSLSWTTAPDITGMVVTVGNVQIDFTGTASDTASSFLLVSAAQVGGSYADAGAVITQLGAGQFRAICPVNGSQRFYCVERQQP